MIDPNAPPPTVPAAPPPAVPETFRDPATGAIQVDALLQAYLDLHRRLPAVPESPDGYGVTCDHGMFQPDPDINSRLHAAGFTTEQAQLLYDLAAERMVPLIQQVAAQAQSERDVERLVAQFGGEARWREISRQILAWAARTLPAAAVEGLSTSYDGIMTLHRMMTGDEPAALKPPTGGGGAGGETELHSLMRDPRYWRDRDPAVVARVTEGFQRLYPGGR